MCLRSPQSIANNIHKTWLKNIHSLDKSLTSVHRRKIKRKDSTKDKFRDGAGIIAARQVEAKSCIVPAHQLSQPLALFPLCVEKSPCLASKLAPGNCSRIDRIRPSPETLLLPQLSYSDLNHSSQSEVQVFAARTAPSACGSTRNRTSSSRHNRNVNPQSERYCWRCAVK
jgi:hypothetical protein